MSGSAAKIEVASAPCATYHLRTFPLVHVVMHRSPKSPTEWVDSYLRPLCADLRKRQGSFALVVDVCEGAELDALTRKEYDLFIANNMDVYGRCRRIAIVEGSTMTRIIVRILALVVRQPIPMASFSSISQAEAWARQGLLIG